MCGILGGTNRQWDYRSAIATIHHRGPDANDVVNLDHVTLAFSRLSIIDLTSFADQPMSSSDQDIWVVFNGEVYDYLSVKRELVQRGFQFKTHSDTEVLMNAYYAWGDKFVEYIDGMFAAAIYDKRVNKLKLFRDRVGIKPLYYFYDGHQFAFSSELKGLQKLLEKECLEIDPTAAYDYLTYLYVPEPKTLYKKVYKLPPAHQLTLDLSSNSIEAIFNYWSLQVDQQDISIDRACDELRDVISRAVKSQMISDVPVGFFLSGGMDSSVVVAEASKIAKKIKTYSIGFDKKEHSEVEYANIVSDHYRTEHCVKVFTSDEIDSLLGQLKHWYDEPFADTSAFPSYKVAELARKDVTVVLTGDGGDEVFGGYKWYSKFKNRRRTVSNKTLHHYFSVMRGKTTKGTLLNRSLFKAQLMVADEFEFYTKLMGGLVSSEKQEYAKQLGIPKDYDDYWHFRKHYRRDLPLLTRLQYLDFHTYLPGDILTKVDRVTMAVSLEARVPLLAKEVIEFSFSLPEEIRYYSGELKGLLKKAYRHELPDLIIDRSKKGFSIPSAYLSHEKETKQEQVLKKLWSPELGSLR